MATPPAQALQRVCPHCSTIAVTAERRCPRCRRSYSRRIATYLAIFALLQTLVTVGAVAVLLVVFGNTVNSELDRKVTSVQKEFASQLDDLNAKARRDLRRELDRRLPPPAAAP